MGTIAPAATPLTLIVLLGMVSGIDAEAKDVRTLQNVALLNGNCSTLVAYGTDISPRCEGKVFNNVYSDGRVSFTFTAANGAVVVTFSGVGRNQVHQDKDAVVQPVDVVFARFKGQTDTIRAVGACQFSNPYYGPAPVACSGDTAQGKFAGAFVSNGSEPSFMKP